MTCMKRGESLFIPFAKGLGVPNSQGRTRMYKSMANIEKLMPKDHGNVEVVEYAEVKHGEWFLLDECSNEGVYCSVCHKKVYRKEYANQKVKSKFCPNCGAKMDGGKEE